MSITLTNALLLDLDPVSVVEGSLRIDGETIDRVGPGVTPQAGDEAIDCHGAVVMAGLVNGHTHLYSVPALGMPGPPRTPRNFHEILELVWWRLDRAHDAESVGVSGTIGALDALRCGTTTMIDHHASPSHIAGSLDDLERGIDAVGLRGVLCYESTDRHGTKDGHAGLEENRRYIERCRARADGRFAAMVGAHAAFTMSDELLAGCVRLATETNTGVHIHVAEDPCDDEICRREYGSPLVDRLARCGIGDPKNPATAKSILAHCTHLSTDDAKRLSGAVGAIAHNPRSNMNNQVGYAPIGAIIGSGAAGGGPGPIQLGTDGIGSDMFAEMRHAWFKSRDGKAGISPAHVVSMLVRSARTAGSLLGRKLGSLSAGAAADVVVTDYIPAAPLTTENATGHLIFAMDSQHVRDVLIGGKWALRNREVVFIDERPARRRAVEVARRVWARMPIS